MTDQTTTTSEQVPSREVPPFGPHETVEFPTLGSAGAHPVAQDRWERLVSRVFIPAPVTESWSALTDPDAVALWLGRVEDTWAVEGAESALDFDDGEFFYCKTVTAQAPGADGSATLEYLWRWCGVGPATSVEWSLQAAGEHLTVLVVTERSTNPPSDWRSWNGMGWPGILDQFADHLRTGRDTRWTWRRMGPYLQTVLPSSTFESWAALTSVPALQFWMGRTAGDLAEGNTVDFALGDASGSARLRVIRHTEPGQAFPSYQPSLQFALQREGWPGELRGHLWIEPEAFGHSILQVFHEGWEMFGDRPQAPSDRRLLVTFWSGAFRRLGFLLAGGAPDPGDAGGDPSLSGPHSWSR